MRRLLAMLFVLATLMVLPAVPAGAQSDRATFDLVAVETPVAFAADGAVLTAGTFEIMVGGVVVETGTVEGRYYDRGTGVHGTRHYANPVTGATADTEVKALVVDVDDSGSPVIVTYTFQEEIIASSEGNAGHGVGVAVVTAFDDGFFILETSATFILNN